MPDLPDVSGGTAGDRGGEQRAGLSGANPTGTLAIVKLRQ
jgi:hypothetical protein